MSDNLQRGRWPKTGKTRLVRMSHGWETVRVFPDQPPKKPMIPQQPPIDNAHVAPGCEPFGTVNPTNDAGNPVVEVGGETVVCSKLVATAKSPVEAESPVWGVEDSKLPLFRKGDLQLTASEFAAHVNAVVRENVALREDKARLDWLAIRPARFANVEKRWEEHGATGLRDAIDQTMKHDPA